MWSRGEIEKKAKIPTLCSSHQERRAQEGFLEEVPLKLRIGGCVGVLQVRSRVLEPLLEAQQCRSVEMESPGCVHHLGVPQKIFL